MNRLRSLDNTPAVVGSLLHTVDHFPHFPADVAAPQRAVFRVKGDLPGIAETIGPDLGTGPGRVDEGIVRRNRIGVLQRRAIDVNSHDGRRERADVLAIAKTVGRKGAGTVPRGDVEESVRAEFQATAVVAAGDPRDHLLFTGGIDRRRILPADRKPRDHRTVGFTGLRDVGDVAVAVVIKPGMKGQPVKLRQPLDRGREIDNEVGTIDVGVGGEREDLALQFDDEQSMGAGGAGQDYRIGEFQAGKDRRGRIGGWRVG